MSTEWVPPSLRISERVMADKSIAITVETSTPMTLTSRRRVTTGMCGGRT